jgi:hypothetical protein
MGLRREENRPSDRDPETLNLWIYSIVPLATKGIGRNMGSET